MSKKTNKVAEVKEAPVVEETQVIEPVVEETQSVAPEVVGDGVVRDEPKETPMDLVNNTVKVRKEGNWKVVTYDELVDLETKGLLIGYDPDKKEALIK